MVAQDGLFGAGGKPPVPYKEQGITSGSSCAFSVVVKD